MSRLSHRVCLRWATSQATALRAIATFGYVSLLLIAAFTASAQAQLSLSPSNLPNGTSGMAYSQTIVASGGTGPYIFAVTSGTLPAGLSLSSGGTISGTPTGNGISNFTITASDTNSAATGSRAYSIAIGTFSLTLLPSSLRPATQGISYSQTISAVGGNPPYTFSVSSGSLPPGLALASDGALTGTPTAVGSFGFIVEAIDADGNDGYRTYTLYVGAEGALTIHPTTLPNGAQGVAYNQTISASGGTGPYNFTISSGALPAGLSLGSGGALTGTPTGSGTFNFTIRGVDSVGNTGSRAYTINIGTASLTVQPETLPNGMNGVAYNQNLIATGGTGPYVFEVVSGSLPAGLTLSSAGGLSGTPTGGGAATFTVRATDSVANTGTRTYTINIGTASLTVNPVTLPNGIQGTAYSQNITASGGSAPYSFEVTSGSLPPGLTLSSSGVLSGTPTAVGTSTFTVQARDPGFNTGTRSYSVTINAPPLVISPSSLPAATQGVAYSQSVTASGGSAPYNYAIVSGSLPPGLSLATGSGAITGTPPAAGSYGFTIQATDATSNTGIRSYTMNVGTSSLTVNPASLPNGTQGSAYSQTVSATGGTGGYTFSVTSGTLPPGLSLSSGGALTGTPTSSGVSNFTIGAVDSAGNIGTRSYTMSVGASSLIVNPASLPNGTQGSAYSQTISATGGTGPYTFSVTSGALPPGLSLSSAGALTGTPSGSGISNFTIGVLDAAGNTGARSYSMNVGTSSLIVNPANLPNGTQGSAYNQTVSATGGTGPYAFSLTSGALPPGLSLSSGGALTGTPTSSGVSNFTIGAIDSAGNTGSRAYAVSVGSNSLTINPASLPAGTQNVAYSQMMSATGSTGTYTFLVSAGSLPTGLTLSGAGALGGVPSSGGAFSFTLRALDSFGNSGTRAYVLNIGTASLTVNPASLPAPIAGRSYRQQLAGAGGTGPYTYSITAGALPAGLSLNTATGVISGTPTGFGASSFTVQVRDANGSIGSRAYSLTSRPDPAHDAEVRGLITSQVATAKRFASAQVANVTRHLESLHDRFTGCSHDFGIALPVEPAGQPYATAHPSLGYPPSASAPYGLPAPPSAIEPAPNKMRSRDHADCALDWASMALWSAGSFQFGSATAIGQLPSNRFNTAGLTVGLDLRVNERLIVGVAGGYGADRTDVSTQGSRNDATSYSGTLYASIRPFDSFFIDASIGAGSLDYDSRRLISGEDVMVAGKRKGSFFSGSLTASVEFSSNGIKFAPYLRGEYTAAKFDQYTEQGSTAQLLTYDKTNASATSGALGLRGSIDIATNYGTLTPTARIEYRHIVHSAFEQLMYYSDLGPGLASSFIQEQASDGLASAAIGVRMRGLGGASIELEYGISGAARAIAVQSLRAGLRLPL